LGGGISTDTAEGIVKAEGFNFRVGSALRGSRFDWRSNTVFISRADIQGGQVNRIMLSEEIQHGLDGATSQASKSIYQGLSNEQFHAQLFQRILSNNAKGMFQFLTQEDLDMIAQIIQGLQ
jgi:hypothetical protein